MATRQVSHEVTIARDPEAIFDYITDPSRWHEWSPSYLPTNRSFRAQASGQQFDIVAKQPLLPLLPLKVTSTLHYVVSRTDRPYLWEVEADSDLVDIVTSYTLSRAEEGTVCKRHLRYATKHWLRYAEPLFLKTRIASRAQSSLEQLKMNLEPH
ncbi:MAG: SRPBCC family protein [Cellvibrionaceae bacterium]